MVILLKTASVRVSSIQIMQVRVQNKGKSVLKSRHDGDVSATMRHTNCSKPCAVPPPRLTPPVIFLRCLGEALCRSHHHHRHHAVMLTELIYSFDPLLNQELEGRDRARCVQNSEVPYVRYSIGRNEKTFDYTNCVKKTLPLSVYEGTCTHSSPLVAMHLLDRSCVGVIFFFEIACYVSQQWHPSQVYV